MTRPLNTIIADRGLQIAVLGALLKSGALRSEDLEARIRSALEPLRDAEFIVEDEGERIIDGPSDVDTILDAALDALGELVVDIGVLEALETINFDGGSEIYMFIETSSENVLNVAEGELDTGGESNVYRAQDFSGLESLAGLKSIWVDGYAPQGDKERLTSAGFEPTDGAWWKRS